MPLPRRSFQLQSAIAALLLVPVSLPVGAFAQMAGHNAKATDNSPLKGDEKLLQVLNRFTYGPRPGDLEKLRAMGIQAWFNQQLMPKTIDDSALETKLANYPAMKLPLPDLMAMYPNQQMVRKVMTGQEGRPDGEAEKAIYKDSIERYKEKLAEKKDGGNNGGEKAQGDAAVTAGQKALEDEAPLPVDAQTLIAMQPDKRFSALCKFSPAQLKTLRRSIVPEDRLRLVQGFTPQQFEAIAAFETPQGVVGAEDIQTKLLRDIYSERQLNEVMVDFWLNHFNVYMKKSQDAPYYIAAYDRDSIRPYALGNFESLLVASATSPAMLNYLDNSSSIGPHSIFANRPPGRYATQPKKQTGLNENYARELMELHTVGVNGGYTQQDVTEVAKVFTGWTVGSREKNGIPTQAQFDESKHEPGSKIVMGVTIKENGEKEGLQVLHLLATSPQTARFISTKLAIRFVSDDPPKAMVDRMTNTFMTTHGDIRKVLLAMVNSPEFFNHATYRAKVKTPLDFVVSAVRASGADVQSAGALANVIADLGMPIYGMQTPNGYSMKADPWNSTSSLIERLNFSLALSTNRVVGVKTDWSAILGDSGGSQLEPQAKEQALEARLLHLDVSDRTRQAIIGQITSDPAQQEASLQQVAVKDRKRDPLAMQPSLAKMPIAELVPDPQAALAAGMLFGSPEFQRR